MLLQSIISILEKFAPPALQESYDNSGLLVGDTQQPITGILVALDSIEEIVDEAIAKNCNLIVAHHPIVFSGLKRLTGRNYIEKTILKAIKNNVAIYAIHTNLDNVLLGVNDKIANLLALENTRILAPKKQLLRKLVTYCPATNAEAVRNALLEAGAGIIGNYSHCSFSSTGDGTFKPCDKANPVIGSIGELHTQAEIKIEVRYPIYNEKNILTALHKSHVYEEIVYDIHTLENEWQEVGSGKIGYLATPLSLEDFLEYVKRKLNVKVIKYTAVKPSKMIQKVALCGGSGSFLLPQAIAQQADVYISSDFKYHEFFDSNNQLHIFDVGHYESEQFTIDLVVEYLQDKVNTPVFATAISTNPVQYSY